ncbi:LacI family DNA-binding transcriptional regulator [Brevibacillus sp. NRS-1366]|uniref:LacI family DNA-binding transcriptional regulator n=1 Tax=Brevibacillus sp. NRS-1366 TaxID=3233899 RepID=UPI003D23A9C4
MKKVTINDVAKRAGVSVGTVSRILNNKRVKPMLQEKVERAISELEYQPNSAARNLRTNKSKAFAFIVTDISNFTFSTIAKALNDVLDKYDYSLILYNVGKANIESKLEHFFSMRNVDGAFLAIAEENNPKVNKLLSELDIPILILDRQIDCKEADFVFSDYYNGVRGATDHLISLGHKQIAFITGSLNIYPAREGVRGYKDAMKLKDLPIREELLYTGDFTADFGIEAVENMITGIKQQEITAIITGGNPILVGVLKMFQKHHVMIGNDVSLISFEDSELAQIMSISVIRRPLYDIGTKMAYTLLDRLIQSESEHLSASGLIIPTDLVIRSSTSAYDGTK